VRPSTRTAVPRCTSAGAVIGLLRHRRTHQARGGTITWSDWAWKDGFKLTDPIEELGIYTFTLSEYEEALAGAARMLAAVRSWEPPKQKMLWPWQWGWRLPKEDDPMDMRIPRIREAVRRIFLETDPAGLGFGGTWFPESEYDTEVDRAISWLVKGRTPEDVAARTMRYLERDWGVRVRRANRNNLPRVSAASTCLISLRADFQPASTSGSQAQSQSA
jgi:hypothetical protein